MDEVAIAVLAAGAGRRLGGNKQGLILAGQSLLERALSQATGTGQPVYVVLGAKPAACRQNLDDLGVRRVNNPHWSAGMGSSIHAALREIRLVQPGIAAILFMLLDQPAVTTEHLKRLISRYRREGKIVASAYAGTVGVPALFPCKYFGELGLVAPQGGARTLLERHAADLLTVPLADGERDIDTPDDLRYWRTRLETGGETAE